MNNKWDIFRVYLKGKEIDTLTLLKVYKTTSKEVKKSLIEHDGYNPNIVVKKVRIY